MPQPGRGRRLAEGPLGPGRVAPIMTYGISATVVGWGHEVGFN